MDQIFDRFERLFKSWVAGEAETFGSRPLGARPYGGSTGDPDLAAAMDELNDFLDRGRTETEARERQESFERSRRAREEAARRSAGTGSQSSNSFPPNEIARAYQTLGLPYGTPFPQVKTQYKKLLMQNHPDRNSASPEQLKRSTEISAQINDAYQRIETWSAAGRAAR